MLKLVFTLALSLNSFAVAPDGATNDATAPRIAAAASPDGVNRRSAARVPRRRGRRGARNARSGNAGNDGRRAASPLLPEVREIDADGLKKLLGRGDAPGVRPLLVNFWATWCEPCRVEFPDLVKIEADYRGRGPDFALVSADEVAEIKTGVPRFLRRMRATAMPAYLLNATDMQAAIAQVDPQWGGELPATFLFDARGQLVFKHTGRIKPDELREAINKVMSNE
ncbi:MAG: TlpA family protein disulfide reductase [Pyrinomonadaceae bacterium]